MRVSRCPPNNMKDDLQYHLNSCIRKNIVLEYMGEKIMLNLNLTDQYLNSVKLLDSNATGVHISNSREKTIFKILEKYLKDEGFFNI